MVWGFSGLQGPGEDAARLILLQLPPRLSRRESGERARRKKYGFRDLKPPGFATAGHQDDAGSSTAKSGPGLGPALSIRVSVYTHNSTAKMHTSTCARAHARAPTNTGLCLQTN